MKPSQSLCMHTTRSGTRFKQSGEEMADTGVAELVQLLKEERQRRDEEDARRKEEWEAERARI